MVAVFLPGPRAPDMEEPLAQASVRILRVPQDQQFYYGKEGCEGVAYPRRVGDVAAVAAFTENPDLVAFVPLFLGKLDDVCFSYFRAEQVYAEPAADFIDPHGGGAVHCDRLRFVHREDFVEQAPAAEVFRPPDAEGAFRHDAEGKNLLRRNGAGRVVFQAFPFLFVPEHDVAPVAVTVRHVAQNGARITVPLHQLHLECALLKVFRFRDDCVGNVAGNIVECGEADAEGLNQGLVNGKRACRTVHVDDDGHGAVLH